MGRLYECWDETAVFVGAMEFLGFKLFERENDECHGGFYCMIIWVLLFAMYSGRIGRAPSYWLVQYQIQPMTDIISW